jgi:hypothetical protein
MLNQQYKWQFENVPDMANYTAGFMMLVINYAEMNESSTFLSHDSSFARY